MKQKTKWKDKVVHSLELPQDIFYGAVLLQAKGNKELHIENYRGIREYTQEKIYLHGIPYGIIVYGKNLTIPYYTSEELQVCGEILEIRFEV